MFLDRQARSIHQDSSFSGFIPCRTRREDTELSVLHALAIVSCDLNNTRLDA